MQWPASPPDWAKPVAVPAIDPGSNADQDPGRFDRILAQIGTATDRVVAALDRFSAALSSIPREIELKAPLRAQGPPVPIVIAPAEVVVRIEPGQLHPIPAAPSVVIENPQTGQMAQEQEQEQKQKQKKEIEDRVRDGLAGAGDVVSKWGWQAWTMIVGLIAVAGTVGFLLLRAWRRRNSPLKLKKKSG